MRQPTTNRQGVKTAAKKQRSLAPFFVGLDVHKQSVPIALVVYEAGPTGYALAYDLKAAGLPVRVIAPNKTPRVDFSDPKSDRLDCRRAAEYAALGMLTYVAISTPDQLVLRQIVRLREQLVNKVRRTKQQIRSLLLFHNLPEPEHLRNLSPPSPSASPIDAISPLLKIRADLPVLTPVFRDFVALYTALNDRPAQHAQGLHIST